VFGYYSATGTEETIRVMRPYGFHVEQTPRAIKSESNARPRWHTQIVAPPISTLPEGARHDLPAASTIARYVTAVAFFTHERGQPVEVRRFTDGAEARLMVKEHQAATTEEVDVEVTYRREGDPVALGFLQSVDAIGFVVDMPAAERLKQQSFSDPGQKRALRTQYFSYVIEHDADLVEANIFQRKWVARIILGALIRRAVETDVALEEAHLALVQAGYRQALLDELARLADADVDPDTGETVHGRHGRSLEDHMQNEEFVSEAVRHVPLLWDEPDDAFNDWLLRRFRTTLGAALFRTCGELTPGRSEEGLVLDLESGPPIDGLPEEERDIIWVTELDLGGTGLVESIAQSLRDDPNQFVQLIVHSLEASDLEQVSAEMPRILHHLRTEDALAGATERVRQAQTNEATQAATEELRRRLKERGILCTHSVFSALSVRLLRSGANRRIEELTIQLLDRWDTIEERLGVEVKPGVLTDLVATDESLRPLLPSAPANQSNDVAWRSAVYESLLWSRGSEVRALALRPYHPYMDLLPTDRRLVLDGLQMSSHTVSVLQDEWRQMADARLRQAGHVDLTAPDDRKELLAEALDTYLFVPIDMEFLHLHPRLVRLYRSTGLYRATLVLKEVMPAKAEPGIESV